MLLRLTLDVKNHIASALAMPVLTLASFNLCRRRSCESELFGRQYDLPESLRRYCVFLQFHDRPSAGHAALQCGSSHSNSREARLCSVHCSARFPPSSLPLVPNTSYRVLLRQLHRHTFLATSPLPQNTFETLHSVRSAVENNTCVERDAHATLPQSCQQSFSSDATWCDPPASAINEHLTPPTCVQVGSHTERFYN